MKIGKERVVATYYGFGHTSGDVVISFDAANVVHMGDLMFNRLHPFIDREAGASICLVAYAWWPRGSTWISRRFLMALRHNP